MGKEGLGRVVMGLNGCRGVHIHTTNKKNTNRGTDSRAGHNVGKVVVSKITKKSINETGT